MKVVVGMSGGVDSAVSAYLLKGKGYEVTGLYMQNWDPALNNDLADPFIDEDICQAEVDYQDAKKVCEKLGIELHRVNFVQEYWDKVFQYFIDEYKKGRTPNPDIFCNKYIKFNSFLEYAFANFDCDYIAMGHYAKVKNGHLYRADDKNKDQTYFLSQLSSTQLEQTLFPLGNLKKDEVRKIAKEQNLAVANKKDSTGICFIGERNFGLFLSSYLVDKKGLILDYETKRRVQEHKGLFYYTIGQRKGLNIGGDKEFGNSPWFVVGKNLAKNELYVSQNEKYLYSNKVIIDTINFLGTDYNKIKSGKFRYRSSDVMITDAKDLGTTLEITYERTTAVTPGQSLVFYNNEECLGGGIVKEVYLENIRLEV